MLISKRLAALEAAAAQAAQQSLQAQQRGDDALAYTLHRLKEIGAPKGHPLVDAPTRAHSSPMECVSWLMHHTDEQGRVAGYEAIKAMLQVNKQPGHSQQDFYDAIRAVVEQRGLAWYGL